MRLSYDSNLQRAKVSLTNIESYFEQLYSSASDREKRKQKAVYNKHQNTVDMQDYQAEYFYEQF